jgi:HD superfamily phosphohydrolase YqeK
MIKERFSSMNSSTFHQIQSWFLQYVKEFLGEKGKPDSLIRMKLIHSRKAAEICRSLAEELGWSSEDNITASALGLLHDVGRFSQFAEYGTFADADSLDHGERGRIVIKESGVLSSCSATNQDQILNGILFHNRRTIPSDADPESLPFVKLVRDADKLDIYRIIRERIATNNLGNHLKEALWIRAEGPANPLALAEIRNRQTVSFENILTVADFTLMQMSWVFDINYPPARQRISEDGVLNLLASTLPEEKEVFEISEFILKQVE